MSFTVRALSSNFGLRTVLWKYRNNMVFFSVLAYTLGYFQLSIVWLLVPIILKILKEQELDKNTFKRDFIRHLASNEEKVVLGAISNLPSWVSFPDMERVEWINKIIKKLWPNVNNYVHSIIKQSLQEKLNNKMGKYNLSGLVFDKLIVGTVPFRIGGVVVYENVSRDEIVFDMDISYAGDCEIVLKYGKLKGGIKDFQVYGRLRVIIKPLIDCLPLAGGLQIFFLNPPDIDFNLEGLAGMLEFPGLSDILKKLVKDTICSVIVLPNKYPIILNKYVSKEDVNIPNPAGVLRIHIVQAKELMTTDLRFTGELTSDPYAVLAVGDQEVRTPVIEHTTKPKWDFWCEFIIEEINGVYMYISLWDDNILQDDEPLGRTKILISKLIERQTTNMWCRLEDVKHGEIQIRSTWLTLSTNHCDLKRTQDEIQQLQVPTLSSALLIVFVDSASDISISHLHKLEPYVEIKFGNQHKSTKIYKKGLAPVWEEGFTFLVTNPEDAYVDFKIMDNKEEKTLGVFVYNIEALFEEDNYKIEKQTFRMLQCENEARITLSMQLRILKNSCYKPVELPASNNSIEVESEVDKCNDDQLLSEHLSLSRSSSISSVDSSIDSKSEVLSPAQIKLTLRYSVQRQRLIVVVHHLEELHFDETKGLYVKLYLLPERHKDTKRKTKIIRTTKNPVFDETFEFVISQDELSIKKLEVAVCEEKILKHEPIEKVVIDLEKLSLVLPYTRLFRLFRNRHEN